PTGVLLLRGKGSFIHEGHEGARRKRMGAYKEAKKAGIRARGAGAFPAFLVSLSSFRFSLSFFVPLRVLRGSKSLSERELDGTKTSWSWRPSRVRDRVWGVADRWWDVDGG